MGTLFHIDCAFVGTYQLSKVPQVQTIQVGDSTYRAIERSITFGVQSYTNNIYKKLYIHPSTHQYIGIIDSVER